VKGKLLIKKKNLQREPVNGILLVDKPFGETSHDVVHRLKRKLNLDKVGHCGTLDPMATGLLILCTGKGTKIVKYLTGLDKEYMAVIQLGEQRDTDDDTGEVIAKSQVDVSDELITEVVKSFEGDIEQVPPNYSAIKVKGKRAYAIARKGKSVTLAPRKVKIYQNELLKVDRNEIYLRITCSKGTYIRSLARDIGIKLGCLGYLKILKRTKVGCFNTDDDRLVAKYNDLSWDEYNDKLISMTKALYFIPSIQVDEIVKKRISNGQVLTGFVDKVQINANKSSLFQLVDSNNRLLAIIDRQYHYQNVFHHEDI